MIAVSNSSALTGLTASPAETNIKLVPDLVDQYLIGSAIVNSAITTAVKTLLKSILESTKSLPISKTINKIAGYAGFSSDAAGNITFNVNNASLDKLTFYIIFRLPMADSALQYEDPLPESATISGTSPNEWGKYANYIRSLNGSGIKKLNSAGVDFDLGDDYFTTLNGYDSVHGLYPEDGANEYKTALFDHSKDYNKLPVSFFRIMQDENGYKGYKASSRKPHWPDKGSILANHMIDNPVRRVYFEREIEGYRLDGDNNKVTITNNEISLLYREYILKDANNNYYCFVNNQTYRFTLLNKEDTFFTLADCEILFYTNTKIEIRGGKYSGPFNIVARKYDHSRIAMPMARVQNVYTDDRRYFIELFINAYSGSGLTYGGGIDLGAGYAKSYQKNMKFVMTFTKVVTVFKLGLGRHVVDIRHDNDMSQSIEVGIYSLLKSHLVGGVFNRMKKSVPENRRLVVVKEINEQTYEIIIYAPYYFLEPNSFFSPTQDLQIKNETQSNPVREEFKTAWIQIKSILLGSFGIDVPTILDKEERFNWLDGNMSCYVQAGITNFQDQFKFQDVIKNLIGVTGGMCWVHYRNHFFLIRQFQLGLEDKYVYHLRTLYHQFYLVNYFNPAFGAALRARLNIGAGRHATESQAVNRLNEAEKYVLVSCKYNTGNLLQIDSVFYDAVNSHDPNLLQRAVNKIRWANEEAGPKNSRGKAINAFINKCISKLYCNVD